MADVGRCPALHPENMDATCSDEHGRLDLASSHVVDGGCARLLNVDKALFGQLSLGPPVRRPRDADSTRSAAHRESESARDLARCTGVSALGPLVDSMPARLTDSMPTDRPSDQSRALEATMPCVLPCSRV